MIFPSTVEGAYKDWRQIFGPLLGRPRPIIFQGKTGRATTTRNKDGRQKIPAVLHTTPCSSRLVKFRFPSSTRLFLRRRLSSQNYQNTSVIQKIGQSLRVDLYFLTNSKSGWAGIIFEYSGNFHVHIFRGILEKIKTRSYSIWYTVWPCIYFSF